MKYVIFFLVMCFITSGCGLGEREQELEKRTNEVNMKEQQLLVKEKSLQLKEQELLKKEKSLDSAYKMNVDSLADTLSVQHPQLAGKWNVTMRCIETTCSGSAVGDTKNEQWDISHQGNIIFAKAFTGDKLVRVYSGSNKASEVELYTEPDNADPSQATTMIVRLQEINENEIRGQREINRPDKCHIIYSLDLKRQ